MPDYTVGERLYVADNNCKFVHIFYSADYFMEVSIVLCQRQTSFRETEHSIKRKDIIFVHYELISQTEHHFRC